MLDVAVRPGDLNVGDRSWSQPEVQAGVALGLEAGAGVHFAQLLPTAGGYYSPCADGVQSTILER